MGYLTACAIILGEQGIGKSHMLGKLFGKWYGSLVDDVSAPHAIDAIQKLWGVEIKEMAAMKKDIDANKRFIDSAKDTRRQAYARRAILYGSELRQHICAIEIYNECFGNDKRKSPTRINEILNRLEGWSLGADIARDDPAYLRQRKVLYLEEN